MEGKRRTGKPFQEKGITEVHGTQDNNSSISASNKNLHDHDQGLQRQRVSSHDINRSMNGSVDKRPGKFSSCTIGAGFMRSLKRSSRDSFTSPASSSSRRKSILNPELSAYDLIKNHFQEEDTDDDFLLEEDHLLCQDNSLTSAVISMESPSKGFKCNSLRVPSSSSSKSEYLSKNLRIAGQGVTLFPWEEPLHSKKSIPTVNLSSPSATTRSSSKKELPSSSSSPESSDEVLDQKGQNKQSSSMPNFFLPEPDYDLSDDSSEEVSPEKVTQLQVDSGKLNSAQNNSNNISPRDSITSSSSYTLISQSGGSSSCKENSKYSSRNSCLNNESSYFVTSPTSSSASSSSSSSESNQHQSQQQPPSKTFTRSILKKTSSLEKKQSSGNIIRGAGHEDEECLEVRPEFHQQEKKRSPSSQLNEDNINGVNNTSPESNHSSGSTFASSSSSLVNSSTKKKAVANNKSTTSTTSCNKNEACIPHGNNLIRKSSPAVTSTSCKTQTTSHHHNNNNHQSQQGNNSNTSTPRKTPLNMMKLKMNNKRNHRKHVTFRSYKDESLILDQITETIPEEDESLSDDIEGKQEEDQESTSFESLKDSQVNLQKENINRVNTINEIPEETENCQDHEDDVGHQVKESHDQRSQDISFQEMKRDKQSTMNLIQGSGKESLFFSFI